MLSPRPIKSNKFTELQNRDLYIQRISDDNRLHNQNTLIDLGKNIFKNAGQHNIVQPFGQKKLNLEYDFWDFKLINGLQSMKRGFFQIVKEPEIRDIAGVQTWAAYVLYNSGNSQNEHYLYYANIGTIVNRYAICASLITNQLMTIPGTYDKKAFLTAMMNQPFYVSRAEFVEDFQFEKMKEVLWFKLS